jgi:hypothetical protein
MHLVCNIIKFYLYLTKFYTYTADTLDEGTGVLIMNISQLKAFLGAKPEHLGAENSIKNQLRDSGLHQAMAAQNSALSPQSDRVSTSASFGVGVYSNALKNTLEIDQQKPDFSAPKSDDPQQSLFDFNEVANNVLNFVGGAITNAKNKGADQEQLNKLFEQASSGVLQGITLAEKDLAGFLNDEIANGISQSKGLIEQGIEKLKNDIFNPKAADDVSDKSQSVKSSLEVNVSKQQMGELNIRTRDGDQVRISFEDIQQFELRQSQIENLVPAAQEAPKSQAAVAAPVTATSPDDVAKQTSADVVVEDSTQKPTAVKAIDSLETSETEPVKSSQTTVSEQNAVFYQHSSLSFSVTGELDKEELVAIGQLVADTNQLAEEFFNGDIETAFKQALELGFDDQELSSFALQLTKVENTQVIKAYETVSKYDSDNAKAEDPTKAVKPIADYLDKLLNVLEGSRSRFEDNKTYENVINDLLNRLGDVATPDLITAINRFNDFNQKLVGNLPIGFQPKS